MFFKKQTFEQEARKYWEKLVRGILVPEERGCAPSEGEVLGMYNDMKTRHPDCKCNILRSGKGKIVQPGDKISGIRIVFSLDAGASVEFVLASSLYPSTMSFVIMHCPELYKKITAFVKSI